MRERQREMERVGEKKLTELHKKTERKRESGRGREVVGVGGYQGQEQLRSPTPAVPSEGRQRGSRWAISGRILAAAATVCRRWEGDAAQVPLIPREQMLSGNCNTNGHLMNARCSAASCKVKQKHPGVTVSVSSLTSRAAHSGF